MATIVDLLVLVVNVFYILHLLEGLCSPVGIYLVGGVAGKPGAEIEEAGVGNGVFIVITYVSWWHLPLQTTIACLVVLIRGGLYMEDGLG